MNGFASERTKLLECRERQHEESCLVNHPHHFEPAKFPVTSGKELSSDESSNG